MNDWRELLCRVLDGEALSDSEMEALRIALNEQRNWSQAAAWIQFEQTATARAEWPPEGQERLLAKAILREKHADILQGHSDQAGGSPGAARATLWAPDKPRSGSRSHPARTRALQWSPIAVVAAALLFAVGFWWLHDPQADAYDAPFVRGDFHVLGPLDANLNVTLTRGDRLFAGGEGAQLTLGGYCQISLAPHSDVSLLGAPHLETLELHQGGMRAVIIPEQGEFKVLTPLGPVQVTGTDFEVTVEYPNGLPGDLSMQAIAKKVVVTVAVLSGAVLCAMNDSPVLLEAGASRVFAAESESNRTRGEVVATTDFSVTLKTENESVTFQVPESNKLAIHEVGQLLKGDQVTVAWLEEGDRKWVRDIDGEGVIEGTVTALGDHWIEIQSEGGQKLRYRAPWRGGNPADGGGPDRDVMRKIATAKVADRVAITWAMPEGKRVMDVKVGKRGEPSAAAGDLTKAPPELFGLSGRVIGRLVSKDVEQGELTLEIVNVDRVWKNNKARDPKSAEGRTLKIDGVFGRFLDILLTLDEGDGVQIEVKHVRGDGLTFLGEELKKVAIEPKQNSEEKAEEGEGEDSEAPTGLNGFRGILIGELVSKDVEKGTLTFRMDKVKRVWKANKAPAPEKSSGKVITVQGIAGKFLDTLLVLEVGDRIEVEAFHVRGPALQFPGEWLKQAE